MTPAAVTTMAAAVQAARVTSEETVASAAQVAPTALAAQVAPTALAAPAPTPVATTLLAAFAASLLATKTPVAPAQVPALWALLAWVRRQNQQTLIDKSAPVTNVPAGATAAVVARPAFVQVSAATPQTNQSAVAVTYTRAQVAGNTNILAIGWHNTTSNITSVTDSAGNIYQLAEPTTRGTGVSQAIYYAKNIKAAAAGTNKVTTTFNTATRYVDIRALEYSGLDRVNPFNVGTSAAGTGTSANSGTVTTTTPGALIFGAGITTGDFSTAGANFTTRIITTLGDDIAQDRFVTATGAYSATAPLRGSAPWVMQVATFKAASAPAGGNTTATPAPRAPSAPPLFVGDYSSGDFSQWRWIQNAQANASTANWPATGRYPAQIVNDPQRGPVARFEVRPGDRPSGDPSSVNRSEVSAVKPASGGAEGQRRWYEFSVKFDPTFRADTGSWGVTNQWHADVNGKPPLAWYVAGDQWELRANRASSPGVYLNQPVLWRTPIAKGQWHDVKMVVNWSTSDNVGYVQLWHNGVRQRLTNGSDTYHIRTLTAGYANPTTYYKEGFYRGASSSTAIVYHTGFRSATSEAGL